MLDGSLCLMRFDKCAVCDKATLMTTSGWSHLSVLVENEGESGYDVELVSRRAQRRGIRHHVE